MRSLRSTAWRITLVVVVISLGMALAGTVAAVPPLPAEYSGTVTINGDPAPAGTVIVGLIGGEERGRLTTTEEGAFGGESPFAVRLLVQAAETDEYLTVTFLVNGVPAGESVTFVPGSIQVVDLTVSASSLTVSAGATPGVIPTDTDGVLGTGDVSLLAVVVSGDTGVQSVRVNLSAIGGSSVTPMADAGNGTWSVNVSSTVPSPFTGGAYQPVLLAVNATDANGVSNTSVAIPLTVVKNGDANQDNRVTLYDAVYTARHFLGIEGYLMTESIGMVSGDDTLSLADAMYLAKHLLGVPGFEQLH
ncbi:hypothetical protein [Methanoculleus taiwanensis]|uniref:hypothetical protein n=1 Tax=Methanoculleus taiwanensis TaxID=1550565 RepID=UPI000FFF4FEF|nr:hypothetical protein [Methanoculleus taiwanensis]